jgi:LPS-assembly lipoprotein
MRTASLRLLKNATGHSLAGHVNLLRFVLLALVCAGAVGCGWRLQGSARLPESMRSVYIDADDRYTDFYRELRAHLLTAGARVESSKDNASAVVRVEADNAGQRVASVSARNTPEQYQVFYIIEYSVELNGDDAIEREQIEVTANYSYDVTAVLAKQREQIAMQQALARELAGRVLRRMASVGVSESPAN